MPSDGAPTKAQSMLEKLKKQVNETVDSVSQAENETRAQLRERIDRKAAQVESSADSLHQKASDASETTKSRWQALRASAAAKKEQIGKKIDAREAQLDAKLARKEADRAEQDAIDAVNFAQVAIEDAEVAVLDALDAYLYAAQYDEDSPL